MLLNSSRTSALSGSSLPSISAVNSGGESIRCTNQAFASGCCLEKNCERFEDDPVVTTREVKDHKPAQDAKSGSKLEGVVDDVKLFGRSFKSLALEGAEISASCSVEARLLRAPVRRKVRYRSYL